MITRVLTQFQVHGRYQVLSECWRRLFDMDFRHSASWSRDISFGMPESFLSSGNVPESAHLITATTPPLSHVLVDAQLRTNDDTQLQAVAAVQYNSTIHSHGKMTLGGSDTNSYYGWTDGGSSVSLPYPVPQTNSSARPVGELRREANGRKAKRKQKTNCTHCGREMTQDSLRRHINEIHHGKKRKKLQKGRDARNISK